MNEQEIELIKQAKEGSHDSFKQLYDRYLPIIRTVIRTYVQDEDTVNELTAITFSKIYRKLSMFTTNDSFKSWVKTIANNTSIDYQRKIKRDSFIKSIDDNLNNLQVGTIFNTEESTLSIEKKELLKECIKKLSLRQRKAIRLYYFENCPYKVIAKKLAVPEGTIKSDLNRAKHKLKHLLTNSV